MAATLNVKALLDKVFTPVEQSYTDKDTMLYAASLGLGMSPTDPKQLQYVYEAGLQTFPTLPLVLGSGGLAWMNDPDLGIDFKRMLHAENGIELHRAIPASGTIVSQFQLTELVDKGADKGALLYYRREIRDLATQDKLATVSGAYFLRGNGGFGGSATSSTTLPRVPERAPDLETTIETSAQAGILYRLNGDRNPLHVDPQRAAAVGFDKPILHGLCTFGLAARAALSTLCADEPIRLKSVDARFSAPFYPGEGLRIRFWHEGAGVALMQCLAAERDKVVLDSGVVRFQEAS